MYKFFVFLLIVDSIVLAAAILLQSGKGGGVAASFGGATSSTDAFIGTRQAGNLLTKASWTCGGIFLALAFGLQLASARTTTPKSVLDRPFSAPASTKPAAGAAPAPTTALPLEAVPTPAGTAPGAAAPSNTRLDGSPRTPPATPARP